MKIFHIYRITSDREILHLKHQQGLTRWDALERFLEENDLIKPYKKYLFSVEAPIGVLER